MNLVLEVKTILDDVLHLQGRSSRLSEKSALLGSIPELDSMAVIALIVAIEERFGCKVEDDEIDSATFATLGSLLDFVRTKV
jgi:acyl carrier protein